MNSGHHPKLVTWTYLSQLRLRITECVHVVTIATQVTWQLQTQNTLCVTLVQISQAQTNCDNKLELICTALH